MPKKAAGRKSRLKSGMGSGMESGLKSGLRESEALPPGGSAALVFCRSFYRPFYGFLQSFFMTFTSPFYDFSFLQIFFADIFCRYFLQMFFSGVFGRQAVRGRRKHVVFRQFAGGARPDHTLREEGQGDGRGGSPDQHRGTGSRGKWEDFPGFIGWKSRSSEKMLYIDSENR